MGQALDPGIAEALEREIGHSLPLAEEEWIQIKRLHITRSHSLTGLERCTHLEMLILRGCGPVDLTELPDLNRLTTLAIHDSDLVSVASLPQYPLRQFNVSRNRITDLTPLLKRPEIVNFDVIANPLSTESYEQILPQLIERGGYVTYSERREWELTVRMQQAGLPFCCYRDSSGLRLNCPGLGFTQIPEAGHPVVTTEELEQALDADPAVIFEFFARRDQMGLGI